MENSLTQVVKAARQRFGEVMSVSLTDAEAHGDFFFVACKRNEFPCPDRPYMTITAKFSKEPHDAGQVSFFSGHYDLTIEKVHAEISLRSKPAA